MAIVPKKQKKKSADRVCLSSGGAWMLMTPSRCAPVLAAILLLSCANPAESQNLQLPALPFDYADLEPAIDSETMTIHHMVQM